ncbi:MAG TPA: hypothetical protein VGF32_28290 [Streptosporangiaceae bacterium]|jgi:phenylacetate-coenzyme A ligase PaaK-like adenylate-forming protein
MTAPAGQLSALRAHVARTLAGHLDRHLARLHWDDAQLARHQRDRLRELLAYAAEHSPFHARRLRGVDPSRFELADLPRLPVMTKDQLMDSFDELTTDRRLTRGVVEAHLAASVTEPSLLFGEYVCLTSGGSSGVRSIMVQTLSEFTGFVASLMRRGLAGRLAAGPLPPGGMVIGLVAAASPVHSSGFGTAVATGPPVKIIAAPATLPLAQLVQRLNRAQPPALLGYPTKLAELAREQRRGQLRIAPRSVTAVSELLTSEDRAAIEDGFGMPVINQFASTEGLAGQSEPGGPVIEFACDMCLVEVVDAGGRPVPDGVTSAKILVTNLHNLTQPLVRYELTDRFTVPPGTPRHGHLRARVEGRADEVFRYEGGVEIHPHVIRSALVSAAAVREYQVRQTDQGIDVACAVDAPLDEAALAGQLARDLRRTGLAEPQVGVSVVGAIPRDPRTGKVGRFISRQRSRPGRYAAAGNGVPAGRS